MDYGILSIIPAVLAIVRLGGQAGRLPFFFY